MKRFYCTICRRVKRVRNLPARLQSADSKNVIERKGVCNRHVDFPDMLNSPVPSKEAFLNKWTRKVGA